MPGNPDRLNRLKCRKNKRDFYQGVYGLACILILLVSSCRERDCIYHQYKPVSESGWRDNDTLIFDIPVSDTLAMYEIEVDVRNTTSYPYKDIYLMVEMCYRDHNELQTNSSDLIRYPLTDDEGKWKGTGWGTLFQNSRYLRTVFFPHPGNLTYRIYHKMNDSALSGIKDVGIKITKKKGI